MENAEVVLRELEEFERSDAHDIPRTLEDYLQHIAKTGDVIFPWIKAKSLIRKKIEIIIAEFHKLCPTENLKPSPNVDPFNFDTQKAKIFDLFETFSSAPFTIQRLCELLIAPQRHYKRTDKFMRGIEKNLLVVSTVEPGQVRRADSVSPSQTFLNGVLESDEVPVESSAWSTENVTTTYPHPKEEERRELEPVDNMSISDGTDSGISDTEDEENSSKKDGKRQQEPEPESKEEGNETENNDTTKSDEEQQTGQSAEPMEETEETLQPEKNEAEENEASDAAEKSESPAESENPVAASSEEIEPKTETDTNIEMKETNQDVDMEASSVETSEESDGNSKSAEKRVLGDTENAAEECHAAKQQRISSPNEDVCRF
nr:EOG090X0BWU [Eulimnadia texana]